MKRLAAVFRPKQDSSDRRPSPTPTTDPSHLRPAFLSKAPKRPIATDGPPHLRPALVPGSSSSSDGSASLRTPEDEPVKAADRKRWPSWLPARKPSATPLHEPSASGPAQSAARGVHSGGTLAPERVRPVTSRRLLEDESESEDDSSSSDSSDDLNHHPSSSSTARPSVPLSPPQATLRAITRNSLAPPVSPPPLVQLPSALVFPRSANSAASLPPRQSFQSTLLRRRLLRRLAKNDLSRSEQASITLFANKPRPALTVPRHTKKLEDDAMSLSLASARVASLSPGLRTWALRPGFEDRMSVWTARTEDGEWSVVNHPVYGPGRGLGVEALEISWATQAMAGLDLNHVQFNDLLRASAVPLKDAPPKPPPASSSSKHRSSSFKAAPSPLRIESRSSLSPQDIVSPNLSSSAPTTASPATPGPPLTPNTTSPDVTSPVVQPPYRGVRFADSPQLKDDSDDLPLSHVQRIRKKRPGKPRARTEREWLEIERLDKEREVQRLKVEEMRIAKLQEEQQLERQKKVYHEVTPNDSDERQRAVFAEEVLAARRRREMHRSGTDSNAVIRAVKEEQRGVKYARPAYDHRSVSLLPERRTASEYGASEGRGREKDISTGATARWSSQLSDAGSRRSSVVSPPPPVQPVVQHTGMSTHSSREDVANAADRTRRQSTASRASQVLSLNDHPVRQKIPRSFSTPNSGTFAPHIPLQAQMPFMGGYGYPTNGYLSPIPPVPALPVGMWPGVVGMNDMSMSMPIPMSMSMSMSPLMPPMAPFMMQQYAKAQGSSSSPSSSRDSSPNRQGQGGGGGSRPASMHQPPLKMHHQQNWSSDAVHLPGGGRSGNDTKGANGSSSQPNTPTRPSAGRRPSSVAVVQHTTGGSAHTHNPSHAHSHSHSREASARSLGGGDQRRSQVPGPVPPLPSRSHSHSQDPRANLNVRPPSAYPSPQKRRTLAL